MPALALCCCMALSQNALFGGVTRTIKQVSGGCRVTLAWDFSGSVESDLIIEERFSQGWLVDDSTVPFSSLDAMWFSGGVIRLAVKSTSLAKAGSISFKVAPGEVGANGQASGDWKLYLGGKLREGSVVGQKSLSVPQESSPTPGTAGTIGTSGTDVTAGTTVVEMPVAISSFKMRDGAFRELSYSGLSKAGTLVVEGCEGLGGEWREVKRLAVAAGDGSLLLESGEVGGCCFMRLKLLTKE